MHHSYAWRHDERHTYTHNTHIQTQHHSTKTHNGAPFAPCFDEKQGGAAARVLAWGAGRPRCPTTHLHLMPLKVVLRQAVPSSTTPTRPAHLAVYQLQGPLQQRRPLCLGVPTPCPPLSNADPLRPFCSSSFTLGTPPWVALPTTTITTTTAPPHLPAAAAAAAPQPEAASGKRQQEAL